MHGKFAAGLAACHYGYYLVEKHGRLIYEACDDGSLKMLYNEA